MILAARMRSHFGNGKNNAIMQLLATRLEQRNNDSGRQAPTRFNPLGGKVLASRVFYEAPRETLPPQERICHKPNRDRIATNTFTTCSASFEPAPQRRRRTR